MSTLPGAHRSAVLTARVAVGIAILVVGACGAGAPPEPTAPAPPADVVPWPELAWEGAALPGRPAGVSYEAVSAVAAGPAGYVAVGYDDSGAVRDGVIWFSPPGAAEWTRVGVPGMLGGVELLDVAAGPGGFVAIGGMNNATVFYRSHDGRVWDRLDPVAGAVGSYADAVAGRPDGYVATATANEAGAAGVWTSVDGLHWIPVAPDDLGAAVGTVVDPQPTSTGWIGLGSNVGPPVALHSDDGRRWSAVPIEASDDVRAHSVMSGRWATIVLGGQGACDGPFASCPDNAVAWWSEDGAAWARLRTDGSPLAIGGVIVADAAAHGIVAIRSNGLWSSPDGWTWTGMPAPGGTGVEATVIWDAVVVDDTIVAVGGHDLGGVQSIGRILVARPIE